MSLEVQVKISPSVVIKADGNTHTEVFAKVAELQEVFGEKECGCCGCKDLTFRVREVDDNKYYELKCSDGKCRATLAYGQHKKGGSLFPKRKLEDDSWDFKNKGWKVYVKPNDEAK